MQHFYFEKPSIKRKKEALEFLNEFVLYNSELNGTGYMEKCLDGIPYEEFLIESEKRENFDYAYSINRCPSITFFLIREIDNKIVGMCNIRYNISDYLLKLGASHIGYCIRPTERKKGYNKIQLYMALLECEKLNENHVSLMCTVSNIPSNKSILALGGKLEKCEIDSNDNEMTNYYSIDVKKSIKDFRNIYEKFITY